MLSPEKRLRATTLVAAGFGAVAGAVFLFPGARLSVLTGLLCPPAVLLFPVYLEVEMRYPAIRHSQLGYYSVLLLVVVLNAALYAALAHLWQRRYHRSRQ